MFTALRLGRAARKHGRGRPNPAAVNRTVPSSRSQNGRGRRLRFFIRRRRLLAGLAAAAAAGITVQALLPAEPPTTAAAAAARDLPAGHILSHQDLRRARIPADTLPPGAVADIPLAVGEQLAVPLPEGTVLTGNVLVGEGMLTGAPDGSAAVPLRPADPAAAGLLSPGILVDVVVAPDEGFDGESGQAAVLAAGVPVLWVTGSTGTRGPWPGADSGQAGEQLVVVAAQRADAAALAVASVRKQVYLVPSGTQPP
ncbi:RcpC/CpaB family pilus assembly protein [Arthrobacter sp. NPDC055585]